MVTTVHEVFLVSLSLRVRLISRQLAMWLPLLLVSCALLESRTSAAETCQSCVAAGHSWCVETSKCQPLACKTSIKNPLNCPMTPQAGYEYTDDFGRNVALPIIVAAGIHDPMVCLKNAIPTSALDKIVDAPCAYLGPNVSCHAYTAYDTVKKVIIISFRGTDGSAQMAEEFESFLEHKEPFFDSGHVYKYFYDAFLLLWRQGLEQSVRNLKYLYPNYDVWVMGHSLGGALASVCSSYMLKVGLATPHHLRLVTFGQPRTGDKDWAQWHDSTFLYSYRIVHHKDIVPHVPPRGGPDEVWHHRFEIWYNNAMSVGDPYQICAEDDGLYCSNTQIDTNGDDHMDYFRPDMYGWANRGCHLDQ